MTKAPFVCAFDFHIQFQKMHNWPALSSMVIPWISVLLSCLFRTELKSFDMSLNNSQNRYNFKWLGRSECAVFREVWKKTLSMACFIYDYNASSLSCSHQSTKHAL